MSRFTSHNKVLKSDLFANISFSQSIVAYRRKESEAETALEEYILKNQTSVEIEEKTSEAEFNLLKDREELEQLQSTRQRSSR